MIVVQDGTTSRKTCESVEDIGRERPTSQTLFMDKMFIELCRQRRQERAG